MNKHLKKCLWVGFSLLLLTSLALPSHASYQCLRLDGNGWASILDANQKGLNMALSDFMIEVRIKTSDVSNQPFLVDKFQTGLGRYYFKITSDGFLKLCCYDGAIGTYLTGTKAVDDGRWHTAVFVADRSGNMYLYKDGSLDGTPVDISSVEDMDSAGAVLIGRQQEGLGANLTGQIDCVRIWNFGYGGLPSDWADYITWRATARNVFKDISEYNSGSWNCYADADRTEKVTDPGIENWTNDTPDDWTEDGESAGVRDITKETTEIHGGSSAAKLEATDNDGTLFSIRDTVSLVANKYYELSSWTKFASRTDGETRISLYNAADQQVILCRISSVEDVYTFHAGVGKPTVSANFVYLYLIDETDGITYFDDISVKRVGLVARWRFESDYSDETVNSNTLTEGGSGNAFPGYTLKKEKIISPSWVR